MAKSKAYREGKAAAKRASDRIQGMKDGHKAAKQARKAAANKGRKR